VCKYTICDVVESKCYGTYDTEEAATEALNEWTSAEDDRDPEDYEVCELYDKLP